MNALRLRNFTGYDFFVGKKRDGTGVGAIGPSLVACLMWALGVLLSGTLTAWAQTNLVIESFDSSGHVVFNRVTNAAHYRVEWAQAAGGSWTPLAVFPGEGSGAITAAVPMVYRVVAVESQPDTVLIPAGNFEMGDSAHPGDESPRHTVYVSAFYMDRYEVTKALWDEVLAWGLTNAYTDLFAGGGKAPDHPVHTVNWFDMVKWCNARSQRDGLTPVYYTDAGFTNVYQTGNIAPFAHWAANGYRLPTEAEWEKAARGGAEDTRFPWTDYTNNISWTKANYWGYSAFYSYDLSGGGNGTYHPTFATGDIPYTSPVGHFDPNGYGLYDMAGNILEACWDWYDGLYYSSDPEIDPKIDPRGPDGTLTYRVMRGGAWNLSPEIARVSRRVGSYLPDYRISFFGFRCARGL